MTIGGPVTGSGIRLTAVVVEQDAALTGDDVAIAILVDVDGIRSPGRHIPWERELHDRGADCLPVGATWIVTCARSLRGYSWACARPRSGPRLRFPAADRARRRPADPALANEGAMVVEDLLGFDVTGRSGDGYPTK